jgi:hypothetical protein
MTIISMQVTDLARTHNDNHGINSADRYSTAKKSL